MDKKKKNSTLGILEEKDGENDADFM